MGMVSWPMMGLSLFSWMARTTRWTVDWLTRWILSIMRFPMFKVLISPRDTCLSHSSRSWSALHRVPPSMCVYDVVTLATGIATYMSSMAGCGDLRASTESHSTIATERVGASLSPSRHIHFPTIAVRVNSRSRDICRVVFVPNPTPPRLSSLTPNSLKIWSGL
jgi:hypothetical protein